MNTTYCSYNSSNTHCSTIVIDCLTQIGLASLLNNNVNRAFYSHRKKKTLESLNSLPFNNNVLLIWLPSIEDLSKFVIKLKDVLNPLCLDKNFVYIL